MSLSNLNVQQVYSGNDSSVDFSIPYAFIKDAGASVTKVYLVDPTSGAKTIQVQGSDYNLDDAKNPTKVTFVTAPATGVSVLVRRELALQQLISYINSGDFLAETHEQTVDRCVMMIQQLYEY